MTTAADDQGVYRFSGLRSDQYTLRLSSPGFRSLTIKGIEVFDGEHKSMPTLELTVGASGCGGSPLVDYVRLLPSLGEVGHLGGRVTLDLGPLLGNTPAVTGANVELICKTNSNGEFLFKSLNAGSFAVRVNRVGFYPREGSVF